MKLSEILPLFEARKNPTINKRIPSYEELKALVDSSDDPDNLYISFTSINKIGINPHSEYDTPLGIYTYPIKRAFEFYKVNNTKSLSSLPFATENEFIQVVKWNGSGKVLNVAEYTEDDLNKDIEKIKSLFPNKNIFNSYIDNSDELNTDIKIAINKAKIWNNPASKFFSICRKITDEGYKNVTHTIWTDRKSKEDKTFEISLSARKWNTLLRKLGYALIIDYGQGIIHSNEKCQAFFTASQFLTRVDMVKNYETIDMEKIKYAIENNAIGLINTYLNGAIRPDIVKKYPEILNMSLISQNFGVLKLFCKSLNIKLDDMNTFRTFVINDLEQALNCYGFDIVTVNDKNAKLLLDSMKYSGMNTTEIKQELAVLSSNNPHWKPIFLKLLGVKS